MVPMMKQLKQGVSLTSFSFVASIYFMLDFIEVITKLSKTFQNDKRHLFLFSLHLKEQIWLYLAYCNVLEKHFEATFTQDTFKGEVIRQLNEKKCINTQQKQLLQLT